MRLGLKSMKRLAGVRPIRPAHYRTLHSLNIVPTLNLYDAILATCVQLLRDTRWLV